MSKIRYALGWIKGFCIGFKEAFVKNFKESYRRAEYDATHRH